MKPLTWNEYYDGFYDWSFSTQKNYSYRLSNFGSPEEVLDIIDEFYLEDPKFASRFAERALTAGVKFTPEQILELTILVDKPVLNKAAVSASSTFDREQLEEINTLIDDSFYDSIANKAGIDVFSYDEAEEVVEITEPRHIGEEEANDRHDESFDAPPQKRKSSGFFTLLLGFLAAFSSLSKPKKKHSGRCDGDCANCPPHYGYRYGRWYYGHDHAHGCEFGGNKCSGSRD